MEIGHVVTALGPTTPSSASPPYVDLSDYRQVTVILSVRNSTTVSGANIALKQATDAAGTGEKILNFDNAYANTDTAASDALSYLWVTSNVFTTDDTDSKSLQYVIEVDECNLDDGFTHMRLHVGDATNTVLSAFYVLHSKRYRS